jgi:hypothetical protein
MPQLDPYGKETLTLAKYHDQEEQGTCHEREKPNWNLGTNFIILGVLQNFI